MNDARSSAARAAEVCEAAAAWKENGAIDAAALEAIRSEYPDPRVRLHRAWRVLVFVLVTVAVLALFLAVGMQAGAKSVTWISLIFAAALAVSTEKLHGSRFAGTGADAASSFWAASLATTGAVFFARQDLHLAEQPAFALAALASFLAFGAAAWRWGFWFHGGVAAGALFILLGRLPWPRLVWIVASLCLIAVAERFRDSAALPPPHRRSLAAALGVSAAALYGAVNLYSLDRRLVEMLTLHATDTPAVFPRGMALVATAILPVAFLGWGSRGRRRLLLDIGLGMAALSVVTWRHYQPIGPRWAFLAACGAVLLLGSLWLGRRLRKSSGGEWRGWTGARSASETETAGTEAAAVLAGAVAPRTAPESRQDLSTGGGQFGGGGASGSFGPAE